MRFKSFQILIGGLVLLAATALPAQGTEPPLEPPIELFTDSSQCIACHSSLVSATGEDVSIGHDWRGSMMANAGRDPYWLASVRREVMDHPQAQEAIEDKCATCHIPAARFLAQAAGRPGKIFEHYQENPPDPALARLAKDGVTCSVCHQIKDHGLGEKSSFTGGFQIDATTPPGQREIYGPHHVDAGRTEIMNSASAFLPAESDHLASSELCATCHTLYTHPMDEQGKVVGELPEQVPFLEWKHSAYRQSDSCQDCHMPVLPEDTAISSVLGEPRPDFSQHVFRGGNAFMLRMLNRFRDELGVEALPAELEASAARTESYLQTHAARLEIDSVTQLDGWLELAVQLQNLAGHKLPTAYPSRRAWLHLSVSDRDGRTVFESGALNPDGSISGNDNDRDARRYEPHHDLIESAEQVQIYESMMVDYADRITTGLMYGVRYIKDNRLLPKGFDKATAPADVAVHGAARDDDNFTAPGDRVHYRIDLAGHSGPFRVQAELKYQSIGFRWAMNLKDYDQEEEPRRFVSFYEQSAADSAVTLASATWQQTGETP